MNPSALETLLDEFPSVEPALIAQALEDCSNNVTLARSIISAGSTDSSMDGFADFVGPLLFVDGEEDHGVDLDEFAEESELAESEGEIAVLSCPSLTDLVSRTQSLVKSHSTFLKESDPESLGTLRTATDELLLLFHTHYPDHSPPNALGHLFHLRGKLRLAQAPIRIPSAEIPFVGDEETRDDLDSDCEAPECFFSSPFRLEIEQWDRSSREEVVVTADVDAASSSSTTHDNSLSEVDVLGELFPSLYRVRALSFWSYGKALEGSVRDVVDVQQTIENEGSGLKDRLMERLQRLLRMDSAEEDAKLLVAKQMAIFMHVQRMERWCLLARTAEARVLLRRQESTPFMRSLELIGGVESQLDVDFGLEDPILVFALLESKALVYEATANFLEATSTWLKLVSDVIGIRSVRLADGLMRLAWAMIRVGDLGPASEVLDRAAEALDAQDDKVAAARSRRIFRRLRKLATSSVEVMDSEHGD